MLTAAAGGREQARLLETFLHAVPPGERGTAVERWMERWMERWSALDRTAADLVALMRTLFNEVSLSPWTGLADRVLAFVRALAAGGHLAEDDVADFLGHLLRQIGRHLTAYDLVTFHHRGANYPDALLLDAVLKDYLALIERRPDLFRDGPDDPAAVRKAKRLRRRALRQGWLPRRRYEGHLVPDLPTSPGENNRVLPPSHPRVPEEQVLQTSRRSRRLFDGDPLPAYLGRQAAEVLRQSVRDLDDPTELRELGTALFLDRPLGTAKAPAEPDRTLLLACVAFSRSVAEQRLDSLAHEAELGLTADFFAACRRRLRDGDLVTGLSLDAVGGASRPGKVALADARLAASDFLLLHTTPGAVAELLAEYDFGPLAERFDVGYLTAGRVLLATAPAGKGLLIYDDRLRPRLELEVRSAQGFVTRAGREYPVGGLQVVRAWEEAGPSRSLDLRSVEIVLRPR
jgi:hypothetical protein